MVLMMSGMEPYGVIGDNGGGSLQNSSNPAVHSSQASAGSMGLMPNMRLAYTADPAAVYKPVMPGASPPSSSPAPAYQAGGDDSSVPPLPQPNISVSGTGEQTKRKRGRPRKYAPDGTMSPGFTSSAPPPPSSQQRQKPAGVGSGSLSSPPSGKKPRGRPPGSVRKHQVAGLGSAGTGFKPHVITVKAGEDVSSKILSLSQNGSQAVCILSANGAISNVTLRQPATSGGTVTYEGRFEILSLSGSYMLSESGDGQHSRTGGLSALLAGPDGHALGGGVAGLLIAASPVQVVVGCFIAGRESSKSANQDPSRFANQADATPSKHLPGTSTAGSPISRGTMSECSGGPGSPLNRSSGACNNSIPQDLTTMLWK